jgi:hypothetical protein
MVVTVLICFRPAMVPNIPVDVAGLKVGEPLKAAWVVEPEIGWGNDPIQVRRSAVMAAARPGYSPFRLSSESRFVVT